MNSLSFTVSDLIAGYVQLYDAATKTFVVKTTDGRDFAITLTPTVFAEVVRNLGEDFHDATGRISELLVEGRYVFVYGVFYPEEENRFEAKHLVFTGDKPDEFRFEEQDWWINQVKQLGDFYLKAQFGGGPIDYSNYRTNLELEGEKLGSTRQETDTISRLVYGFASAYLMTGDDRYLEAAEKGTEYLRTHFRFEHKQTGTACWYHAVDIKPDGTMQKVFASEFGDDYDALPCYEQIYALAGPTQTYRITGDPRILADAKETIKSFRDYYRDHTEKGGFYSHIDPITLSPHSETLGANKSKKNWNSVGDHAPAYLINLYLATGEKEYADFLEETFDTIAAHFPDYDESPFVQERFHDDWSKDQAWGWQQNRAVVGHNLKIAWNLMRMNSLTAKKSYTDLATKIADVMPTAGYDLQRGGWYDVVERVREPGQNFHRFVWHDRKAWWQQEQAILAYFILAGVLKRPDYDRLARESASFYNAWFLDTQSGGVYFNVLANGLPYAQGTERGKGSHSMSGYHSFELAYLAAVYTNLLVNKKPMDFHFCPTAGALPNDTLRVSPDLLPEGSVRIGQVWINGQEHRDFDAAKLTVKLPQTGGKLKVRVRLVPQAVTFTADLLGVDKGVATISLAGKLTAESLPMLRETVSSAVKQGARSIVFEAADLESISEEGMRVLAFTKQKLGATFDITVAGACDAVKEEMTESGFVDEIILADLATA
ncbi:AGE family epimerase/isomerase [Planctellipticum variicoloris]|uniref:AGE family epimerase/isomerase n=1 Tax=Planctellipticum variicoloris TaxID=3064265 RepID=UPI0030139DDC|nr:AGE family epimerase/isomerase [Planctomycetaceae bacterium SH412]